MYGRPPRRGAVSGMGVYFAVIGLDKASEVAGVLGAFIGLAGLALAFYGSISGSSSSAGRGVSSDAGTGTATRTPGGTVTNIITDSTVHGNVFQAGEIRSIGPNDSRAK
jgi:hypothetical protein